MSQARKLKPRTTTFDSLSTLPACQELSVGLSIKLHSQGSAPAGEWGRGWGQQHFTEQNMQQEQHDVAAMLGSLEHRWWLAG
jgi:hypothetical protein